MKNQMGFSLLELLIAIALFGIVVSLATMSMSTAKSANLTALARQLHSDLQAIRLDAMTRGMSTDSRGFGLRFTASNTYELFEYVDNNASGHTAFKWDGADEEIGVVKKDFPTSVSVTIGASGVVTDDDVCVCLYGRHGLAHDKNWGMLQRTYVLRDLRVGQPRCLVIDEIRIREGVWNGGSCTVSQ
ncbi:MAG TPA: prepilin-type N-terminal cleavage/methylation domain-containing protein [Desulfuromonadales bacterium]|nr:prepilin-type N-terminal cleavage/methylation domain-containing protein [Desulfuromonadales bacterium]